MIFATGELVLFGGGYAEGDTHMISDLHRRVFVCMQSFLSFVPYILACLRHGSLRYWSLLFSTLVLPLLHRRIIWRALKKKNTTVSKLHPLSVLRELELLQNHLEGVKTHIAGLHTPSF